MRSGAPAKPAPPSNVVDREASARQDRGFAVRPSDELPDELPDEPLEEPLEELPDDEPLADGDDDGAREGSEPLGRWCAVDPVDEPPGCE